MLELLMFVMRDIPKAWDNVTFLLELVYFRMVIQSECMRVWALLFKSHHLSHLWNGRVQCVPTMTLQLYNNGLMMMTRRHFWLIRRCLSNRQEPSLMIPMLHETLMTQSCPQMRKLRVPIPAPRRRRALEYGVKPLSFPSMEWPAKLFYHGIASKIFHRCCDHYLESLTMRKFLPIQSTILQLILMYETVNVSS